MSGFIDKKYLNSVRKLHSTLNEISQIPGNPDSFQVISGKLKYSRKFREIQDNGKSTKICRKYYFYGMKKIFL